MNGGNDMSKLLILGAGGHGKVVAEIALMMKQWDQIVFLDDDGSLKEAIGIPVIGKIREYELFKDDYKYAFVAIGNNHFRIELINKLIDAGFKIPILIHPSSIISTTVKLDLGTAIMGGTVINTSVEVGKGCIVNTSSSIDHDCSIKEGVHISPGVNIGGTVEIGKMAWIGIGSNIINNINIGRNAIVGAGSVVIKDLPDNCTAVGIPAKPIKFHGQWSEIICQTK
jgi:sugar O-acyltransferase (sialic acid O-acetyltransferase NeuD family)